jgi:acyl carrier protein
MPVSSRTPESLPSHCPLCGAETNLEFSEPAGDASCPNCSCLLWKSRQVLEWIQDYLADTQAIPQDKIVPNAHFFEDIDESLELVELLMQIEDEFEIVIPDEDYEQIRTVSDLVRYIINQQLADSR